jgi:hypothetical protein
MGKGAKVGFLNHVLRLCVIMEDAARHTEEAAVVALHDDLNCNSIPASGALYQRLIIECLQ